MTPTTKRFLVVLPVRNGGAYVRPCLAGILAQTHANFRLAVLDNASDDGTLSLVQALRDPRIFVHPSPRALSIEDNWRRIATLDGDDEFLTIIGHDDILDPQYLARMAALIDAHPAAGLYQAGFRLIDARGRRIRSAAPIPAREMASEFLAARLALRRDSFGTGYVCRLADYRRAGGIPAYPNLMFADDALWLTLMQGSYKACDPRESFSYRLHSASTSGTPPWRPTYAALNAYLDLLLDMAARDSAVAGVLRAGIGDYLAFWYRWAYFTARAPSSDRAALMREIEELSARIRSRIGAGVAGALDARVRRDLGPGWPRVRWFLWRLRHHLSQRLKNSRIVA